MGTANTQTITPFCINLKGPTCRLAVCVMGFFSSWLVQQQAHPSCSTSFSFALESLPLGGRSACCHYCGHVIPPHQVRSTCVCASSGSRFPYPSSCAFDWLASVGKASGLCLAVHGIEEHLHQPSLPHGDGRSLGGIAGPCPWGPHLLMVRRQRHAHQWNDVAFTFRSFAITSLSSHIR